MGSIKAPFSLIKGHNFQLLIPFDEKERIKKLPTFTNLNEYIDYQDGIIDYYDELIGLSSDDFGVNKKPHNRFLKADGSARDMVLVHIMEVIMQQMVEQPL